MGSSLVFRRSLLWACAAAVVLSAPSAVPGFGTLAGAGPGVKQGTAAAGSDINGSSDFSDGSLIRMPGLDRFMTYDAGIEDSAVVIGDSQTGPDTWVARGLAELGYRTVLRGAGGTGYTRGYGSVGSYYTALTRQQWLLPWGNPKLVVLQGGGNDVGKATDRELAGAAEQMIAEMRRTYPQSRLVMVGVISSDTVAGRARREADRLLASVARDQGVEFLRVGDWWSRYELQRLLEPDGRHFTPEGHRAAGRVFARELGTLLEAGRSG